MSVITVSDSRNQKTDENGAYLRREIEAQGHKLTGMKIVPDEPEAILEVLENEVRKETQVILFNGGTGISRRDRTFDAIECRLEKAIPGFGELFRYLSYRQIGSAAMLSRAAAGIYRKTLVFLMPGSPKAVRLAWEELISPEIRHMVWEINR